MFVWSHLKSILCDTHLQNPPASCIIAVCFLKVRLEREIEGWWYYGAKLSLFGWLSWWISVLLKYSVLCLYCGALIGISRLSKVSGPWPQLVWTGIAQLTSIELHQFTDDLAMWILKKLVFKSFLAAVREILLTVTLG